MTRKVTVIRASERKVTRIKSHEEVVQMIKLREENTNLKAEVKQLKALLDANGVAYDDTAHGY